MVKISSNADPKFRSLAEEIIRMTRKKLDLPMSAAAPLRQSPVASPPYSDVGTSPSAREPTQRTSSYVEHHATRELPTRPTSNWRLHERTQTHPQPSPARTIPELRGDSRQSSVQNHPPDLNRLTILDIPEPPQFLRAEDKLDFSRLAKWDVIFIVDDTGSMQLPADNGAPEGSPSRWDLVVDALRYIANEATKWDEDGVDIHFLVSDELNGSGVKKGQVILNLLDKVDVEMNGGGTRFEPALHPYISKCLRQYNAYFDALNRGEEREPPKPMEIIVLTDGAADDKKSTEKLLVKAGEELDRMFAPSFQLGVQFVQVGDDNDAKKYLERLDKRLREEYTIRDVSPNTPVFRSFRRTSGSSHTYLPV